jgi:hypothetical protein
LLPPKAELETNAVLRKAIAAKKALVELKGAGELIPNQGVLINAIVLQNAKLSSEIENVVSFRPSEGRYRALHDTLYGAIMYSRQINRLCVAMCRVSLNRVTTRTLQCQGKCPTMISRSFSLL